MKFSEQSLSLAFDQMVVSAVPFTPALPDSPCQPKVGCKLEGWFQAEEFYLLFNVLRFCHMSSTNPLLPHWSPFGDFGPQEEEEEG